jgi:hypothetical protein
VLAPGHHGQPAVGWPGTEPVAPGAAELGQERGQVTTRPGGMLEEPP